MADIRTMTLLVDKLARQPTVGRHGSTDDAIAEAERLGHALFDLRESFDRYVSVLYPKLVAAKDYEVMEILEEIGDEVRHIAYHLRDSNFLKTYAAQAG